MANVLGPPQAPPTLPLHLRRQTVRWRASNFCTWDAWTALNERTTMNEHFLKSKPVAPPKRFAESELATAVGNVAAVPFASSDSAAPRELPNANLDFGSKSRGQPSVFGEDPASTHEVNAVRTALAHGVEVCEEYVHNKPWHAALLGGTVGLLLGLILSSRSRPSR